MDTVLPLDSERIEAGRQLGYDYYRFTRFDPDPAWDRPVREGFYSADARRIKRETSDRFTRKWLQVRGNALRRDRIVDNGVTRSLIKQLDVANCPILRIPLTHGLQLDSDWSVDRLNNDSAYAPGNLSVISTLANRAKASHSFEQVHERGLASDDTSGLSPQEWMRMASLMLGPCFAEMPSLAPILPLLTPLPVSTVRSATQMIQYVLTIHAGTAAGKNLLIKQFTRFCSDSHARAHVCQVAELIHLALKTTAVSWDIWNSAPVMRAFLAMRASVSNHAWAMFGDTAMNLSGGRQVVRRSLVSWHLGTAGHFSENWRR